MGVNDREQNKRDERRDKRATAGPKAKSPDSYRFINIELTADQKDEFRALLAAGEFDNVSVDSWLSAGYKVTLSTGDGGKTVICSVVCGVAGDPNYQQILTGRGGDATTAIRVAAYKDTYLCEDGVWATSPNLVGKRQDDIG